MRPRASDVNFSEGGGGTRERQRGWRVSETLGVLYRTRPVIRLVFTRESLTGNTIGQEGGARESH